MTMVNMAFLRWPLALGAEWRLNAGSVAKCASTVDYRQTGVEGSLANINVQLGVDATSLQV